MEYVFFGLLVLLLFSKGRQWLTSMAEAGYNRLGIPGLRQAEPYKHIIVAALIVAFLFVAFAHLFPETANAYVVQGGPVWWLGVAFVLLGATCALTTGDTRRWLTRILGMVIFFWVLFFLLLAFIYGDDYRGQAAANQRQVQAEVERQQQLAAAEAAQAQAQAAAHRAAAEAAGGKQCLNVPHRKMFGTQPDDSSIVDPGGKCSFNNFEPPHGTCFYMQAVDSTKRYGPFGTCERNDKVPFTPQTAPWKTERVWSAGEPFEASYVLRPRNPAKHGLVN